jgi:hypothetical protein
VRVLPFVSTDFQIGGAYFEAMRHTDGSTGG